jgi:PmbA protein
MNIHWDSLEISETEISVDIINSEANSVRIRENKKAGVRVLKDGNVGIGAAKGQFDFDELFERAQASLALKMKAEFDIPYSGVNTFKKGECNLSPEVFYGIATEFINRIRNKNFILSNNIKLLKRKIRVRNSKSTDLYLETSGWSASIVFKHRNSLGIMDGVISDNGLGVPNFDNLIQQSEQYFNFFDKKVSFKDFFNISSEKNYYSKLPVLLINPEEHFFSKLKQEFSGKEYHNGTTIFSNELNNKIFSEKINILDSNIFLNAGIYMPFDTEGTLRENKDLFLIKNGVFYDLAYDLKTAFKLNKKPTGNGFRTITGNGSTGYTHLNILPGEKTVKDLSLKPIIVPMVCAGGDMVDNGNYSTPVQLAFIVHKGEIIGRLPEFSMNFSFIRALNEDLIDISSERWQNSSLNPALLIKADIFVN